MTLPLLTAPQITANQTAAAQAASTTALDFVPGTVLLAIAEANTSVASWLQFLIFLVLLQTRAATSTGPALDTWMADYNFTRISGGYAVGNVTFARFTDTVSATIAVGDTVLTGDLTQSFAVVANGGNAYWNGTGYTIPSGTPSASIPVQAVTSGTGGNVLAGAISLLGLAIPGVDTVTNPSAFTGGTNAESDTAFRARFILYIGSLARSTLAAINYAISSVSGVQSYSVTANYDPNGAYDPGSFYAVIDDGTGSPSSTLLAAVDAAFVNYAALGIRYSAIAPSIVTANISMVITVAAGYTLSAVEAQVQAAVIAFVNAVPVGGTLSYTLLSQAIYAVSPGITDVESLTINSGTSSLTSTNLQVIKAGTVTVT